MKRLIKSKCVLKIFDACTTLNCVAENVNGSFEVTFYTSSDVVQGGVSIYFYVSITNESLIKDFGKTATLQLNCDETITMLSENKFSILNFWNNIGLHIKAHRLMAIG